MRIEDLESILAFTSTDKRQRIEVNITYGDGIQQRCEIKSFGAFSDGIWLNVETDICAETKQKKQ